jgi:hypothetical protein
MSGTQLLHSNKGSNMYWDVIDVKPEAYLTLSVVFADGLCGRVRFLTQHLTGVFTPLKDPVFFEKVFIDDGVVTWPGEIDLAPDAMHQAIQEHGEWILE